MTTKLTLSISSDIVEKAKSYFQSSGQSLSGLVEEYFRLLIKTRERQKVDTPIVNGLSGVLRDLKRNEKEVIYEYLKEKYK